MTKTFKFMIALVIILAVTAYGFALRSHDRGMEQYIQMHSEEVR